ncbi:DUF2497 domain-containing protein [Novosphingobium sp.]|uniref:DUF2497 domain-containing protein n=1 Tax=Novosphingobium sp. TaxID=1874826 RepID=UPI00262F6A69|nr:DUF2497 domain-containing protein [Novosphingobium sp.]
MRQAGEPTVEEILDSIKKVIARDGRLPASEDRRPAPAPTPAASRTQPAPVIEDEVLDLAEAEALDLDEDDGEAPLLPDQAVHAMRDSLAALATMAVPGVAPQIVRSGETSLEGLVRDMLRPMLAEWLDRHLPPMVERLVAAEIARIVGKKG